MEMLLKCLFLWFLALPVILAQTLECTLTVPSAKNFENLLKKDDWDKLFPNRWFTSPEWKKEYNENQPWFYPEMRIDYYSYANFIEAIKLVSSKNLGMFLNEPGTTDDDKKRELCAFLGNIAHETGKGEWGLYYREEIAFEQTTGSVALHYQDVGSRSTYRMNRNPALFRSGTKLAGRQRFPQVSYHGRGPIQLSWGYNYGDYSKFLFNDPQVLLNEPDKLLDQPVLGIGSALWYWMAAPDRGRDKLPHYTMYKKLVNKPVWGLGQTIMAINGGLEGNARYNGPSLADQKVTRRINFYKRCAELVKVKVGVDGEQLDTVGLSVW